MYRNGRYGSTPAYVPPPPATITSSFDFQKSSGATSNLNITRVNMYDFAWTGDKPQSTHEQAITRTVQYLGWMSLKNDDHNASGANATQSKRILKDAIATRAAADRLIAAGTVVLLGTWSNGIAVGPGAGFTAATAEVEVIASVKKSRKARASKPVVATMPDCPTVDDYVTHPECADHMAGWHSTWTPDAMHGPAYVPPLGNPPGLKFVDGPYTAADIWYMYCDTQRGEEPVQPATIAPTPIYAPAVGDSVFLVYLHENGTTTDRVIDVTRVMPDGKGFRGHDRRYGRTRNFYTAQLAVIRKWTGEEIYDQYGTVVIAAA